MTRAVPLKPGFSGLRQSLSLQHLTLAKKFGIISGILIIGFAALGAAYYQVTASNNETTERTAAITHFGEDVSDINIRFLELRRIEKDFLIDRDAALLDEHAGVFETVDAAVSSLTESAPTEAVGALLDDMALYLGLYKGSFNEMAASMETAGLDADSGLAGKLNASAGNIEELVNGAGTLELHNALLQLRQSEHAFMATPTEALRETIQQQLRDFETRL
ncbi:MAG TPA: hypothetical protein VNR18_06020, partial [Hyphomicrobiales bacterium]|nr:hypothetical protein [Hyphomicrobiales bacterium]